MDKIQISKNKKKGISLSPLNKIHNNKKFYLSRNHPNKFKFNYKSEENSSLKKINYLKYKQDLFKKCNSQILENKKISPIFSNRKNNMVINNSSFLQKTPLKSLNLQNKNKRINIPISYRFKGNQMFNKSSKNTNFQNLLKSENKRNSKELEKKLEINNINDKESSTLSIEKDLNSEKSEEIKNIENNDNISISIKTNSKRNDKQSLPNSPAKYSKFYNYSKRRNVSAKKIYEHYINEEINQNYTPIVNFTKYIEQKFNCTQNKLNRLYGIDKIFLNNLEELKTNKSLAFKDDFNIQEYQKILLGMLKKRIRPTSLFSLKQDFKRFNEKVLRGFESHRGRYTILADKIRDFAPIFLINKLYKLDDEKIKENAKYLNADLNKKEENDAYDEFEYYLKNKFEPDIDNNKK